ncbi:hypothetical protein Tco_0850153 [Tanacetum coccineum]
MPNVSLPQGIGIGGSPRCQEAMGGSIAQTRSERVPTQSYDSPLPRFHTLGSDEGTKVLADAAKENVHTYTRRRRAVSTGSGGISTASRLFSTAEESVSIAGASMPVSTAAVRLQEELDEEERQKMARVHEAAQSFTKKEWENIKARVEADEELSRRLQAEERNKYSEVDQAKMLVDLINQRKKYFAAQKAEAKRNKSMIQAQQRNYMINYTKHMGKTEDREGASELADGSSQATITDSAEVESSKRAAEVELDHEGSKKQKTNEASGEDLVKLWILVKERFSSTEPTDDKERILLVELKRLFEPNTNDTLWKLQTYMHDPLKWRLYYTCGVHHVSTERGMDIFMLVEKEYPLSKGVLMLMLVNKLLVEQSSEMENEPLRKIFIQENRPRQ